jgi:hypothetical protein
MDRKDKNKAVPAKDLRNFVCNKSNYNKDGQKSFLDLLNEYFKTDNYSDYNEWHKLACASIKTCLDYYYNEKSVSYGKEQKIVNMTMKGIYCLEGASDYIGKFKSCHMALDSFTLEWFYRCCNSDIYKEKAFAKDIGRKNLPVWSNMAECTETKIDEKTKTKKTYCLLGYYDIQEKIVSLIKEIELEKQKEDDDFSITPFEAEFFIWTQMQITIAAEALYSNFSDDKEIEDFKAKNIRDKYKMLQDLFSKTSHNDHCFI